jgi:hypothetical protein
MIDSTKAQYRQSVSDAIGGSFRSLGQFGEAGFDNATINNTRHDRTGDADRRQVRRLGVRWFGMQEAEAGNASVTYQQYDVMAAAAGLRSSVPSTTRRPSPEAATQSRS